MDSLSDAVRTAILQSPCTLRALARKAGVPPSTLSRITSGERAATRAVASAVAAALENWANQTDGEAERIRQALGGNDE